MLTSPQTGPELPLTSVTNVGFVVGWARVDPTVREWQGGIVTVESTGTMYGRPALAALREIVAAEKKRRPARPGHRLGAQQHRRAIRPPLPRTRGHRWTPRNRRDLHFHAAQARRTVGRWNAAPTHAGNGDGGGRRLAVRVGRSARDLRGGRRSPRDHPRPRSRPPATPGSLGYRTGRCSGHQPAARRTDRAAPDGHRPDRRHLLRRDRSADCGHRAGARTTRHPAAVGSHRAVPAATTQPCRDSAGSRTHQPTPT